MRGSTKPPRLIIEYLLRIGLYAWALRKYRRNLRWDRSYPWRVYKLDIMHPPQSLSTERQAVSKFQEAGCLWNELDGSEIKGIYPAFKTQLEFGYSERILGGLGRSVDYRERHRTGGVLKNEQAGETEDQLGYPNSEVVLNEGGVLITFASPGLECCLTNSRCSVNIL